jgi:hypothetical protein
MLGLGPPPQFVDVRDDALLVMLDRDLEADRILRSGVREWLVSGSKHDTAFWW